MGAAEWRALPSPNVWMRSRSSSTVKCCCYVSPKAWEHFLRCRGIPAQFQPSCHRVHGRHRLARKRLRHTTNLLFILCYLRLSLLLLLSIVMGADMLRASGPWKLGRIGPEPLRSALSPTPDWEHQSPGDVRAGALWCVKLMSWPLGHWCAASRPTQRRHARETMLGAWGMARLVGRSDCATAVAGRRRTAPRQGRSCTGVWREFALPPRL